MTRKKVFTEMGQEYEITATVILSKIGNQKPYFSVTGEIWEHKNGKRIGRDCVSCGCLHEDILKHWPDLADVIALHLSDDNGVPMYAVENGWYWNGGTKWQNFKAENVADLLRISVPEAEELHSSCQCDKSKFAAFVASQMNRWQIEANTAIAKYNLQIVQG